jgi:hypothetical protein
MWFAVPAPVLMFVCAPGHFGVEAWMVARHGAMTINRSRRPAAQARCSVTSVSLDTPWVRDELREHLSRLADHAWLVRATSEELDELLDALDETGVLEDPGDRIGYVLRNEGEAVAMAKLGLRLNYAQQDPTEEGWQSVAEAARAALDAIA